MLDLLEYSAREHAEKLRLREEQAEERRLRLEEKKAILDRMEYPPVSPRRDKRKKGKKTKGHSAKNYELEFEATLATMLPSKSELLPYLPTPGEIIRETEGKARLARHFPYDRLNVLFRWQRQPCRTARNCSLLDARRRR